MVFPCGFWFPITQQGCSNRVVFPQVVRTQEPLADSRAREPAPFPHAFIAYRFPVMPSLLHPWCRLRNRSQRLLRALNGHTAAVFESVPENPIQRPGLLQTQEPLPMPFDRPSSLDEPFSIRAGPSLLHDRPCRLRNRV